MKAPGQQSTLRDMRTEIRRIDVEDAEPPRVREDILDAIADVEGVEKVVAFPDIHQKPRKEVPSSIAVATRDVIVPNFSSVNQNCGMCYLQTDIQGGELNEAAIDRLMSELRKQVPAENSTGEPVTTQGEIERTILEGGAYACDRFGLDPADLVRIEERGNALPESEGDPSELLNLVPGRVYELGQRLFGHLGGGNHFIELQVVSEELDAEACREYGIDAGRVFLLFHTDSLGFGGQIGFFYGSRPTPGWKATLKLAAHKIAFHGPRLLRSEWRDAVFGRDVFNPVSVDSAAGRVLLAANQLNANFGYANRTTIGKWLINALSEFDPSSNARIFVDSNHNSIRRELINGDAFYVHRHNSVRVQLPQHTSADSPFRSHGVPVLLPGFNDTSSYLALGLPGSEDSLYSADHGGAKLIARTRELGSAPERTTRKHSYSRSTIQTVPHRGDGGIDSLIETLGRNQVLRPLARLTPLATLKL